MFSVIREPQNTQKHLVNSAANNSVYKEKYIKGITKYWLELRDYRKKYHPFKNAKFSYQRKQQHTDAQIQKYKSMLSMLNNNETSHDSIYYYTLSKSCGEICPGDFPCR